MDRAASNQRSSQSAGGSAPLGGSSSSRPRSSGWSASEPDAASSQPDGGYTGSASESSSLSDNAGTGVSRTEPTWGLLPLRGVRSLVGPPGIPPGSRRPPRYPSWPAKRSSATGTLFASSEPFFMSSYSSLRRVGALTRQPSD